MKKCSFVFGLLLTFSAFSYAGQLLYACQDMKNSMTFSESSLSGEPLFGYVDESGNSFNLRGNQMTIHRTSTRFSIRANLINHPQFSSFYAVFPIIAGEGRVKATIRFRDRYGMPMFQNTFICTVRRVIS